MRSATATISSICSAIIESVSVLLTVMILPEIALADAPTIMQARVDNARPHPERVHARERGRD